MKFFTQSFYIKTLKSQLIQMLAKANGFPTRMTERKRLDALLAELYPLATDKPLIRLGPKTDGGYLVPDDFAGIAACFSPGVSTVSDFEKDCAERGMQVFLADRSVDGPAVSHDLFHFTKKYLGVTTNEDFMTLDNWVKDSVGETNDDLLLQIDIEGYEYEVFLSASDALMRRFRIIVAEFHHLDQLWNKHFFNIAERAFAKLLQTHACVHIHPNNCTGSLEKDGLHFPETMEFTFLRRDRIEDFSYQRQFPHPLDYDNTTEVPSLPLPRCWYRGESA